MQGNYRKDAKIVIIGAGPAGLSAALYLKDNGFKNVTVLEKLGRVGGLCRTITQDYKNFDLGANYITPAFRETLRLARRFGAKMYGEGDGAAVELPLNGRDPIWRDIWPAVKKGLSTWKFLKLACKYFFLRLQLHGVLKRPGFAGISQHPELCVSFIDWLKKHELEGLQTLFETPITIMGYGFIQCPNPDDPLKPDKEIPAPYALKYMSPLTFITLVGKLMPLFRWVPWPKRFILGYQRLWEVISFELDVLKNVRVERVLRNSEQGGVSVTFNQLQQIDNEMVESQPKTMTYDAIFIATPLQGEVVADFLKDMTREERELLGHVVTYSYRMTSCHVPGLNLKAPVVASLPLARVGMPWAITQQFESSDLIQFYSRLETNSVNYAKLLRQAKQVEMDKCKTEAENPAEKKRFDIKIWDPSTYKQGVFKNDIDPNVLEFVERLGGEIDRNRWQTFDQWPYFQHFRVEEIRNGFYDRFESLQGENNTFYVGGLMNFELVNHIAIYSKQIVNTYFPR